MTLPRVLLRALRVCAPAFRMTLAAVVAASFVSAPEARAQATQAPRIQSSDYTLQIFQGPITTASRVIGVAGAYTALAEWCEGAYSNAASPAVRAPYSLTAFDFDICLGFTSPGAFGGVDFENRGTVSPSRFDNAVSTNLGLQVQYGRFGITVDYDGLTLGLEPSVDVRDSGGLRIDRITTSLAWSLFESSMHVGVGARSAVLNMPGIEGISGGKNVGASALQLGAVYAPKGLPLRAGLTVRDTIRMENVARSVDPNEATPASPMILPNTVVLPWELELGLALQLGPKTLNPEWLDPFRLEEPLRVELDHARLARAERYAALIAAAPPEERERVRASLERREKELVRAEEARVAAEQARSAEQRRARSKLWSRKGVLLLMSLLVTGGSASSIGIESFLTQTVEPFGAGIVVSPRLGFETELVPDLLIGRGGTYLEPSRFENVVPRAHLTAGADLKLIVFSPFGLFGEDPWRVRLAVDIAPRYFNWALALGKYH